MFEKAQFLNQNITLANMTSKLDKNLAEFRSKVKETEAGRERIMQETRFVKAVVKHRMASLAQQLSRVAKEIESIAGIQKSHKRRGSLSDYGLTTIGQTIPKKKELDISAMYGAPVLSEPNLVVLATEEDALDEDLNDAGRFSGYADRKANQGIEEGSNNSFEDEDEEENELNQNLGKEAAKNVPCFPQNFHIGMEFKKKSIVASRRPTAKEEKFRGELASQSVPQDLAGVQSNPQYLLDAGLENLLQTANQLKSELLALKDWLITTNSRMRLFNLTAQSKMNEIFTCKNCFQKYRLTDNQPGGCMYHSGRLRYLSCLECGSLEYYTCCRVCSKCKPGCNTSLHSPLVQYSITK